MTKTKFPWGHHLVWNGKPNVQAKDWGLLGIEAWNNQDFNGVWTRDLAIPVQRSSQLSYEEIDVDSWSFVSYNEPMKNGCETAFVCGYE